MEKALALVVHDIRNPLASIKMTVQMIVRSEKNETSKLHLERILRILDRIDTMIQSLLDVSRIRSGETIALTFRNCDLTPQLKLAVEDLARTYSGRVKFVTEEEVLGDWGVNGLRRAVENLVVNAVKYGDPKADITISLKKENESATLIVHNHGNELSGLKQEGLFDFFHRTETAEHSPVTGWGLGLALVKGVAEAHQGNVIVRSTKETGTDFIIQLPIQRRP